PSRRQPRGPPVLVAEGDAGEEPLVLPDRTTEADGDLLAVALVQHVLRLEVALGEVRRRVVEVDPAVLREMDDDPVRRGAEEGEPGDLELSEAIAEGTTPVGLLDAPRQRALAPDARPVGVGEARAGEGPGREDQGVGRREGVDGGRPEL